MKPSYHSNMLYFHFSPVQGEQTSAHHPVEPPRASNWRKCSVHCLHSTDAVHGCWRHAPHNAVWGNPCVAPPRGQVAEHPLPPLWLTQYSLPVRDSKDIGHGPKCHRVFPRKQEKGLLWFYSFCLHLLYIGLWSPGVQNVLLAKNCPFQYIIL